MKFSKYIVCARNFPLQLLLSNTLDVLMWISGCFIKFITFSPDIDECKLKDNGCSPNADCNNTIGSFKCICKEDFYGSGKTCTGNQNKLSIKIFENFEKILLQGFRLNYLSWRHALRSAEHLFRILLFRSFKIRSLSCRHKMLFHDPANTKSNIK